MAEVASGYISLYPKFASGFQRGIEAPLSQATGRAGVSGGRMFAANLAANLTGAAITKVASGMAGIFRGAFRGGLDRLMNIEQAEVKLQAVGADVAKAMEAVDNAVTGTRFAISDAANMSATLFASNIQDFDEIQGWLETTARTAQFMGGEFSDAELVISKIAAQGRVTGQELNQLPIAAAALSEHLGVSQEEVRKLAATGKISAEDFREAMDSQLGDIAQLAGTTMSAMIANIRTALNAGMANLLGPVLEAIKPLMPVVLDLAKGVRDALKPIGQDIGNWLAPRVEAFADALADLPAKLSAMASSVGGFIDAFRGPLDAFRASWDYFDGDITSSGLAGFMEGQAFTIRTAWEEASGGVRAFGEAWKAADGDVTSAGFPGFMERLANTLLGALGGLRDAWSGFLDGFGDLGDLPSLLAPLLTLAAGPLGILKSALLDVFSSQGGIDVGSFGETVGSALRTLLEVVAEVAGALVGPLAQAIGTLLPLALGLGQTFAVIAGDLVTSLIPVIADLAQQLLPALAAIIGGLIPVVTGVVESFAPLIAQLVEQLVPVIMTVVQTLLPPLVDILLAVAGIFGQLVEAIAPLVTSLVEILAPAIANIVETILPPLAEALAAVAALITDVLLPDILGLVEFGLAVLTAAIEYLLPVVVAVFEGIAGNIGSALEIITGIINTATAIFTGDWSGAWDGMKQIASGAMGLIRNAIDTVLKVIAAIFRTDLDAVKSTVTRIFGQIVDFIKGIPGKVMSGLSALGNLSKRAADWFGGFLRSARDKMNDVVRFHRDLPKRIVEALGNIGSLLTGSGRALLDGFISGIAEGFGRATDAVKGGLSRIRNFFPFSPAKEGPFSGRGYVDRSGLALAEDFAKAIERGQSRVRSAAEGLMGAAALGMPDVGDVSSPAARAALGPRIVVLESNNHYPQAEPSSRRETHLMDHAAAMGLI